MKTHEEFLEELSIFCKEKRKLYLKDKHQYEMGLHDAAQAILSLIEQFQAEQKQVSDA